MKNRRAGWCVVALCAAAACGAGAETAEAQYLLRYAGDGAARRARDALVVVTQAEQSLDTGHRTLAGWLLWAAEVMLGDAADALPDADALREISVAQRLLREQRPGDAARFLTRAGEELRRLAAVWDVGDAEPNCAVLLALAEKGDCPAALSGIPALVEAARMDPVRRALAGAGEQIAAARGFLSKGRVFEALRGAGEAKERLRAAIIGVRLARAKILASHARRMAAAGSRWRAGWTLGRASRRLARVGAFADEASADAASKIMEEISRARRGIRAGEEQGGALAAIEAKIVALIGNCCPRSNPAGEGGTP